MYRSAGFITSDGYFFRIKIVAICLLDILWQINNDYARFSRSGNIERFFDDFCLNFPFPYCNRIFADAPCNADNIHLLECVIANQVCRYLPRKAYQRNAVIICSGNSRNKVRSTGAAGHKTDAHPSRGTGIPVCRMD